jgi:hypothetical protein
MNALDYLKIVGSQLVLTGYRDKHNQLVDKVIYDIKIDVITDGLSRISFYMNNGVSHIDIPTSLTAMSDVELNNVKDGQTIIFNTTKGKWVNSTPALSSLSDVSLDDVKKSDVLMYDGDTWVNGISENTAYSSTTFVSSGDPYTNAISTLDTVLALLAPAKPSNLQNITLSIASSYSAVQTKTGITRTNITANTTPTITFTGGAFNAADGALAAELVRDNAGTKTTEQTLPIVFTTGSDKNKFASDASNNLKLTITEDYDYHAGVTGKSGFWMAFLAKIDVLSALTSYPKEEHQTSMTHSKTGKSTLTFYVDDAVTPTVTGAKVTIKTGNGTRRISGVPTLNTNDVIKTEYNVNNAIKAFYMASIAQATSNVTNTVTATESGIKTYGAVYAAVIDLTVAASKHTEDLSATMTGYNSQGTSASASGTIASSQTGKKLRIDTKSSESSRKVSGEGDLPSIGFGGTYDSTKLLTTDYLHELQMNNGLYQYPSGDYTNNYPVSGPNYNGLTGYRYVTFELEITAKQNITITFNNANASFNSKVLSNFKLQVLVKNADVPAQGTTGWVNGNAAYGSVTNPTANNDPALVMLTSTNTVKVVTFGQATKSGMCYIRIGMNETSGHKFSDITISAT